MVRWSNRRNMSKKEESQNVVVPLEHGTFLKERRGVLEVLENLGGLLMQHLRLLSEMERDLSAKRELLEKLLNLGSQEGANASVSEEALRELSDEIREFSVAVKDLTKSVGELSEAREEALCALSLAERNQ